MNRNVPLTNNVIKKLNEITILVEDKGKIKDDELEEIKTIFKDILQDGERYDVDDIESWFENEGTWSNKAARVRIINLAHYVQDRFEQSSSLKILANNDDDSCGCGH